MLNIENIKHGIELKKATEDNKYDKGSMEEKINKIGEYQKYCNTITNETESRLIVLYGYMHGYGKDLTNDVKAQVRQIMRDNTENAGEIAKIFGADILQDYLRDKKINIEVQSIDECVVLNGEYLFQFVVRGEREQDELTVGTLFAKNKTAAEENLMKNGYDLKKVTKLVVVSSSKEIKTI